MDVRVEMAGRRSSAVVAVIPAMRMWRLVKFEWCDNARARWGAVSGMHSDEKLGPVLLSWTSRERHDAGDAGIAARATRKEGFWWTMGACRALLGVMVAASTAVWRDVGSKRRSLYTHPALLTAEARNRCCRPCASCKQL